MKECCQKIYIETLRDVYDFIKNNNITSIDYLLEILINNISFIKRWELYIDRQVINKKLSKEKDVS